MARRMAGVGRVTVSLRRSTTSGNGNVGGDTVGQAIGAQLSFGDDHTTLGIDTDGNGNTAARPVTAADVGNDLNS